MYLAVWRQCCESRRKIKPSDSGREHSEQNWKMILGSLKKLLEKYLTSHREPARPWTVAAATLALVGPSEAAFNRSAEQGVMPMSRLEHVRPQCRRPLLSDD